MVVKMHHNCQRKTAARLLSTSPVSKVEYSDGVSICSDNIFQRKKRVVNKIQYDTLFFGCLDIKRINRIITIDSTSIFVDDWNTCSRVPKIAWSVPIATVGNSDCLLKLTPCLNCSAQV